MKRILLIASITFLAACGGNKDPKAELADLKKQRTELDTKIAELETTLGDSDTSKVVAKDVEVFNVVETNFKNYLEVQGKIDAEQNIQVNPETQGVVTAVYVKIGQNVNKGQVLAQIDDKVMKQNIAELQTQLNLTTSLYNRQKNLWDQKIGTEVQFINAKTQKEAAENKIATLRSQIATYKIKAPISGTIDALDLKVGQSVAPSTSGIRIVNASNLKAKAQIAETYAGRVNEGDQVNVVLPDIQDSLSTKINFASKTIDPASRSFEVQINLPSNKKYRPNMLAVLKIVDYQNPKALVIPISAVQKSESGEFVYVAVNGIAKKTDIKTGKSYEGKVEVSSGLKVGDKLITAGAQNLNADDAVKF